MEYHTHSPEQTEQLGADFAKTLSPGDIVAFSGDLGAGKTAFSRGVLRGLGYEGRVTSPTFAIANEYQTPGGPVVHLDLYRLTDPDSLYEIGFDSIILLSQILRGERESGITKQYQTHIAEKESVAYLERDG